MCSSASDMVSFHAEQQAVVEQSRMVDAVGVGDQGVGHPGQVQQPIPVGVVAGQPRNLQRQHDSHLSEPDLGGQLGEPGPARGTGTADAEVVIDHLTAPLGQPSAWARAARSYWRAVDSLLRSTWAGWTGGHR